MSIQAIASVLADLIKLHKQFNEMAKEKTEIIRKNDMPALDQLLKKETALIKQLKKLEQDRLFVVNEYLRKKGIAREGVTMAGLIEMASGSEQVVLNKLQKGLLSEIEQLKEQNALNQQLLEDSLRFVNLSLDLIAPDPEDVNYRRPNSRGYEDGMNRSIFDSKA